ncbi:extracellular solute-binding protein [Novisyntrophococcus fermenticellae]|uniref:extracellular solute-binding protein n=1 Tax=Novisyntrophococcus fermenticellae TaxID=2068655 RepID=UPI001E35E1E4|nr:extracellular solute-binding protein [Novisyntrophococcus fermenticellae]
MKRKVAAVMLSAVMAVGLAACGGGSDETGKTTSEAEEQPSSKSEEGDTKESSASGGREEITLFRSDDGNGAVEAVIEGFEASQDQYKVKWVTASNDTDQTRSQLNTAFSAGSSEYDLVSIDTVWAGDMAAAGYIEPLDSYMMKAKRSPADYNKGSIQAGTYNAKTYALPLYPDFGVIFFRSDIVSEEDAAKLRSGDYTWDEFLSMAEKYKGQSGTKAGFTFQANQYEGLVCNANEYTANFTDVKGGLEAMKKIVDSDATPDDILVYQESEAANSYVNGDTVFSRNWPYVWGLLAADDAAVKQEQTDVAPIPGGSCIGGWLLAMNAKSEHKDGAWAFLDYFTSLEGQKIFCSKGGYVPGYNAALDDAGVKEANQLLGKEGFIKALENTIARPSSDKYEELSDALQISIHKFLSGESDLDTTTSDVEGRLNQG